MPRSWPSRLSLHGVAAIAIVALPGCKEPPPPQSGVAPVELELGKIDPDGPRIEIDDPFLDFGEVLIGVQLKHDFVIRNPGKKTLHIVREQTSCGCTAAFVTDRDIPAGGTGTLRVMYTPRKPEPFSNHVNIYHNAAGFKPVRLDIIGQGRFALRGPRLISLGRLRSGRPTERTVPLDLAKGADVTIKAYGTSHPFLKARVARDGDKPTLTVTFDGRPAPQRFRGWVWIDTNRKRERAVIPVTGVVTADLQVDPPRVYLGRVAAGRGASQSVQLKAARGAVGSVDVKVDGPPWLTARVEPAGGEAELTVSLAPDAKPGRSLARVSVRRTGGQWIEIPVQGYVIDGARPIPQ